MRTSRSVLDMPGLLQSTQDQGGIEAFARVAVATHRRRRTEQRVEHRLLGRVVHCLEQVVEPPSGDVCPLLGKAVAVRPAGGGGSEEDLAAAVLRGRTG